MSVNIVNKRASFEYHFLDKLEAGLQLTGTEVKSLRDGKANITDAYCYFLNGELFVKNLHISPYDKGGYANHDPLRTRKLLLSRQELDKWSKKLNNVGLTIIPVRLYFNSKGFAKLEIALAQGKKLYDKRDDLKKKDATRDIERARNTKY